MRRFLSLSLALWLMWAWADAPAWISRAETITPTDLRAHLEFIASDELERARHPLPRAGLGKGCISCRICSAGG
jgi:hypothetical protein